MSTAPLTESILELYDSNLIAYNRKKMDYIRVAPSTGTSDYANTSGLINFEMNNQQYFLYLPEAFIYCEFDLVKRTTGSTTGTRLQPKDNITLEHNWFLKLFTNVQLDVGSGTLESINEPDVYDDMIRYVKYNKSYIDTSAQMQGWLPDTNEGTATKHFSKTTSAKMKIKQVKQGTATTDIAVNTANPIGADVEVANPNALEEVYNHLKTGSGANHGFSKRMRLYNTNCHFVSK